MLSHLNMPVFHAVFQLMIFAALTESGTGVVHAVNQRIAKILALRHIELTPRRRLAISAAILVASIFVATRFGLVALIANGYRFLAYIFLAIYVLPVLTLGPWRSARRMGGGPVPT
jgi:uncharacterized membrane protein YkvI